MEAQGRMVRMVLPQKHQVCVNGRGWYTPFCTKSVGKQKHPYSLMVGKNKTLSSEESLELEGWR